MARIPGRNAWLAWPAGILCAAVVGGLVWLALPMGPVVAAWLGETLRAATAPPIAAPTAQSAATARETAESERAMDCRSLYPRDLWVELSWRPAGLLSQNLAAPATTITTLTEALAPAVRLTCGWRFGDGTTITTTLARVGDGAASIAEAALQGEGFSCETSGAVLRCTRTRSGVVEEHAVSGDLWLSSVESGEPPEDYGARLAAALWG